MLSIQHLSKRYGEHLALNAVTLEASGGEVYGLLGANGAGKTTLLRTLSTLLKPTAGTATVAGYDVVRQAAQVRACVGLVSGGMGLHDRLTGRETLRYFGQLYGLKAATTEQRIEQLNEQLQLRDVLDVRAGGFSTGMKQKIVVARALLHNPPVVLLDEATSGLDVLARRHLLNLVHSARTPERLIVYSTHVMSEVEELCDRVAVIARGEVLRVGSVAELISSTKSSNLERAFFELLSGQESAHA